MVKICNQKYPNPSPDPHLQSLFDKYPFSLSDFQKYAIEGIVCGQHVLATAHTGSGKTLPAEFAIDYFVRTKGRRVIYTSPIKALSNQKYYEFTRKFPDISFGLITGDIKTNPDADVLIMTTEILMNYGYGEHSRGGHTGVLSGGVSPCEPSVSACSNLHFQIDIANELACVIFDEVHYINDADRGQTWENTILMLPKHIQMIMLSATIDRPEKFAQWCERGGGGPEVWLVSTNHRVVPLTHYSFMTTTESIFKQVRDKTIEKEIRQNTNCLTVLQTANGQFSEQAVQTIAKTNRLFDKYQIRMKRKHVLNALLMHLRENEQLPAIFFMFSRKQVELCAKEVTIRVLPDDSKIPYTIARECEAIVRRFPNHKEYLELPEYLDLVKLLECGIGIHHSGMIPVLREIVEIMISKKYIHVLFATESFAIGLDCPIKTAVFLSLTKFDGTGNRLLYSHEYTQMAGRAGRRGIDTVGNVIHCNNLFDTPGVLEYRNLLQGPPQTLVSKFEISHRLILRLFQLFAPPQANTPVGLTGDGSPSIISQIVEYIEKSMMSERLKQSKLQAVQQVNLLNNQIEAKRMSETRTPAVVCERYLTLIGIQQFSNNKKRKENEREIQQILDEWRYIKDDVLKISEVQRLESELEREKQHLQYLETHVETTVQQVIRVLMEDGLIGSVAPPECPTGVLVVDGPEPPQGPSLMLLPKGRMAAGIAEIDPLIFIQTFYENGQFAALTTEELVEIMTCWTNIKVAEEYEVRVIPDTVSAGVKQVISCWTRWRDSYMDRLGCAADDFSLNLIENIREWMQCSTEAECKWYLQTRVHAMGISTGDFTKAVLKISTIGREISAMAEQAGWLELLAKLSEVDERILKFIVVNQSLYV
jgi:superfamily II RNA helicase